ncbi:helix-turn-helix domain-containing protein [Sphingobacterium spiritivorum]|uniref:helix-turn-helix domain-containing protein n=1 Tax=Sphingobacterium spiritivorum TaxID=258 RepID=UPI003DA605EB
MNNKEIILEELLKSIGRNLLSFRTDKGEEVGVVAKNVGIKPAILEKIEAGTLPVSLDILVNLTNYYKVSLQQVLDLGVSQIYHFTQTNSAGNNHKQYVVNDHTNGYELLVDQLQKEVVYLRGYFERYVKLTENQSTE